MKEGDVRQKKKKKWANDRWGVYSRRLFFFFRFKVFYDKWFKKEKKKISTLKNCSICWQKKIEEKKLQNFFFFFLLLHFLPSTLYSSFVFVFVFLLCIWVSTSSFTAIPFHLHIFFFNFSISFFFLPFPPPFLLSFLLLSTKLKR